MTNLPAKIQAHDEAAADPPDERPAVATIRPEPQGRQERITFAELCRVGEEDNDGAWIELNERVAITDVISLQ